MRDTRRTAMRLLGRVQAGDARPVLRHAESLLRGATGDLAAGPACLHFVRSAAFSALGDLDGSVRALELMLAAAEREESAGWQACALAARAGHRLRAATVTSASTGFAGAEPDEYEVDVVLRDLAAAETLVLLEDDPLDAVHARVAIASGYFELRLYELAGPHFQAAYELSGRAPDTNRSMWLVEVALLHLHWALELYQVGQVAAAEEHTAEAERYALRAVDETSGPEAAIWRDSAFLAAACANADRHDPAGAATAIDYRLRRLEAFGVNPVALVYARPFHAVALRRSGRIDEALQVMEQAVASLPPDAGWLITAATHRTHAVLLAARGSAEAQVGLTYGDSLAVLLWRQRLRTLYAAESIKALETLRLRHEQATRAADVDALTGIANRRAFDRAVTRASAGKGQVTALMVDTDKFKQINDTRGHAAGDAALREISRALSAALRDGDMIGRLGGDEFGVLLVDADTATARDIAWRMVRAVRAIPDCPATISVGVASAPASMLTDTVRRADEAMYRVKRTGGDAVEFSADRLPAAS